MALPPKVYQFLVSIFASLGSFLFGYDLGVIAEAIASESFIQKFGNNPNELYGCFKLVVVSWTIADVCIVARLSRSSLAAHFSAQCSPDRQVMHLVGSSRFSSELSSFV